jgi:lipopolysaccharide export system protein LptA
MKKLGGSGVGIVLFLTLFCATDTALAAEDKSAPTEQPTKSQNPFDISLTSGNGPINIRSGKLEFFYNEKRIVYRDGVVATRDNGTIKSDLLTVTYEEQAANNGAGAPSASATTASASEKENAVTRRRQRIKEAVAEGNVEITSETGNATCKKAIFNEIKRTVVLSGDAVLRDGDNTVKGQTVTVYLDESRVTVEGTAEARPEMQLNPKQDEKGKKEAKTQ